MNLEIIIKKLKEGDQLAFRELVFAYTGKLMVVAKIYTHSIEDAKDALQDGFIQIYKNIEKVEFNREAPFLAWMRKIVMNEALKKYRKKSFKMEGYNLELVKEPFIDPIAFDKFEKEELQKEIYQLPLRFKQVVCLFALEGYSHKEIGKILEIEPSTSRAAYTRAKIMLRKKMNPANIINNDVRCSDSGTVSSDKVKCI